MTDLFAGLRLEPLPDGRNWRLALPWNVLGQTIPAGFVTDLASIPRPLWWLLPRWGKYGPAAIYHDWLYRSGKISRKKADEEFLLAMDLCGVREPYQTMMYWAVRWFGFRAWNRRRKGRQ